MKHALKAVSGIFAVTLAGSMLLTSAGCSNGSKSAANVPAQVSLPENPRSVEMSATNVGVSANNPADQAKAQSEEDFVTRTTSRDLDLGQGSGGTPTAGQPLTYPALGQELQTLGVNPQDQKSEYLLSVKATIGDTAYTFPITVSFSKDQSVIWIATPLYQVDKNEAPSEQAVLNLLTANFQTGLSFFNVDNNHMLWLSAPLINQGVTPQALGSSLKEFFVNLKGTEPVWKVFASQPSSSGGGGSGGGGTQNPFQ